MQKQTLLLFLMLTGLISSNLQCSSKYTQRRDARFDAQARLVPSDSNKQTTDFSKYQPTSHRKSRFTSEQAAALCQFLNKQK